MKNTNLIDSKVKELANVMQSITKEHSKDAICIGMSDLFDYMLHILTGELIDATYPALNVKVAEISALLPEDEHEKDEAIDYITENLSSILYDIKIKFEED